MSSEEKNSEGGKGEEERNQEWRNWVSRFNKLGFFHSLNLGLSGFGIFVLSGL